jgi:hypothetical protein
MAGEFDLHQLLAGPVIAMNDAQADAAASFYELFDQFAFEPAEAARAAEPAPRRLRMISFVAERATAEGVERRQISMPLLQMIPIGGVAIDSAKIQFSLAVNAEAPAAARRTATAPAAAERAVALKGRIAPAAASDTAAGNLQVEIVLKQVDLPAGYLDMIAETQGGMSQPVSEPPASPPPPPREDVKGDKESEDSPLFEAELREPSARAIAPGRDYGAILVIKPNPELVGPEGLAIAFASEPKRAFEVVIPEAPIRLDRGGREQRLQIAVAEMVGGLAERVEVALQLNGSSVGPDGVGRRHAVRLLLPRDRKAAES